MSVARFAVVLGMLTLLLAAVVIVCVFIGRADMSVRNALAGSGLALLATATLAAISVFGTVVWRLNSKRRRKSARPTSSRKRRRR